MKLKLILALTAVLVLFLSSLTFTADEEKAPIKELKTNAEKFGYTLGLDIGSNLKELPTEIDMAALFRGLEDALKDRKRLLTPQQYAEIKQELSMKIKESRGRKTAALTDKNRTEGEAFLAENQEKEGIITTESGLQYIVLREGDGPKPKETDRVAVHYRGTLIDGTEFDSSYKRGEPITFEVMGVIAGWTEALQLMNVGSKYRLFIHSELGYGERGAGADIGPNATLIFEVELLSIEQ